MASPFFIGKKDGSFRHCQDYQHLNNETIKNAYPLPFISELMDLLYRARYFTKLDIYLGYNNIWINEGDQWKRAFTTNQGLFEPTVMFFGMCNSLATFQAMDNLFKQLKEKRYCIVYMDDILIYAESKEKLCEVTLEVLKIIRDNDLYLKTEKCEFYKEKTSFLSMVMEHNKVSMDPAKLKGISEWPTPTSVKEIRSFLGLCNYYRRFIEDYANQANTIVFEKIYFFPGPMNVNNLSTDSSMFC